MSGSSISASGVVTSLGTVKEMAYCCVAPDSAVTVMTAFLFFPSRVPDQAAALTVALLSVGSAEISVSKGSVVPMGRTT